MNHPEDAADIMIKALLIYLFKLLSPSVFRVTVFVPSCLILCFLFMTCNFHVKYIKFTNNGYILKSVLLYVIYCLFELLS